MALIGLYLLITALVGLSRSRNECWQKTFPGAELNIVCVCNSTYCDDVEPLGSPADGEVVIFTSSLSGQRLKRSIGKMIQRKEKGSGGMVEVRVDASKTFQEIFGFGGAFTDSTGLNIAALSKSTKKKLMESYFGPIGLNYTTGRVPMASTDFSTRIYSYDDYAGDLLLTNFSLVAEDTEYKIPLIKEANSLSGGLRLIASPWSAPGWMKTSGKMKGGAPLKGDVMDGPYYKAWANYFIRFFNAYSAQGISFWGTTVQNEPSSGAMPNYKWQTMLFTASSQRDFIKTWLGPSLKTDNVTKNLKLIILDDNRYLLPTWADIILDDKEAAKYVDGIGVHWYGDAYSPASILTHTASRHPNTFILATEASAGFFLIHGPILGDWYRAESYASDIISDLNNFVIGWIDWNLCLDLKGGPTWAENYVDAPILVNKTADEFYKQPMYYALAHFSRYFPVGSKRIVTEVTGSLLVEATAVLSQGRRAVVILNRQSVQTEVKLVDDVTKKSTILSMEPHSIATVIWDKAKK